MATGQRPEAGSRKKEERPARRESLDGKAVERLIARLGGGDTNAAVQALVDENAGYRDRHRDDTEEIKRLHDQLPKEGEVVLSKDDAAKWAKITEKKIDVAQVDKDAEELAQLRAFKKAIEMGDVSKKAAKALNLDEEMLIDQVKVRGLHVELKKVKVKKPKEDGTGDETVEEERPFVRPMADEKATLQDMGEYIDTLPAAMKKALQKSEPEEAPTTGVKTGAQGGIRQYPAQRGGDKAPTQRLADKAIAGSSWNPLAPKKD